MQPFRVLFVSGVILTICLNRPTRVAAAENSWTKPTSGFWEEQASWSLGVLPDATQSVLFTNAGWKAVAIGANTAQNFPQSMRVQSLRLEGPVDSFNTLLMNWSGFEQPLQTTSLTVGSNASVAVHGSVLEVLRTSTDGSSGNLSLGGSFIHSDLSRVKVDGLLNVQRLGISSQPWAAEPGRYFLTNGILTAGGVNIGGMSGPGEFFQYGGSNNVGGLQVSPVGKYELYGGQATATNGFTIGFGDFASEASFVQHGGSVKGDMDVNGRYVLNGGTITGRMSVPSATTSGRADGRVLHNGGTNFADSLNMGLPAGRRGGGGYYELSNGVVRVSSSVTLRGGQFSQYDGVHTIVSNLNMQGFAMSGLSSASAYYLLRRGTVSAAGLTAQAARFWQEGGTNLIAGDVVLTARPPQIDRPLETVGYTLADGLFSARNVSIDAFYGGFHQSGGSSRITDKLTVQVQAATNGSIGYTLEGGSLTVNTICISNAGAFYHLGGTNHTARLFLTDASSYMLSAGTLITSNTLVENGAFPLRPRFVQSGGEHRVKQMLWLESGGVYELKGGALSADLISLRASTQLHLEGGIISSNKTFEINGGTLYLDGNHSLGHLLFNGISHFDFRGGSTPSVVHFTKVGYEGGALDGELRIHNWDGQYDHFYIATADAQTPSRLRSIKFSDPAGYPPGTYDALRRPNGEIVPLDRPAISYTRENNRLVLTWPEGYQLYTSDKVTGPFEPMNAQSGWSATFSDPQRFFLLRPAE